MLRLAAGCALLTLPLAAQSPAPAGPVVGVGNFIHVVANLDKAIEFYHDLIGLDVTGAPGPHNFSANAVVSSLYDAPGAQSRVASLRIPGAEMAVEMVEFQGVGAAGGPSRQQDPGAITLTLLVRDLDAVAARLKSAKAQAVSAGSSELLVRDPDGIFVKLSKPDPLPATTAPATSNVIGAGFGITVADMGRTTKLFRDVLGFAPQMAAGRVTALIPGSTMQMEFLEFKGIEQNLLHPAIHDPGAGVLRLRVRDLDAVVKALKDAGAPVVSVGGEPVSLGRSRAVIVRDPSGLYLQALQ